MPLKQPFIGQSFFSPCEIAWVSLSKPQFIGRMLPSSPDTALSTFQRKFITTKLEGEIICIYTDNAANFRNGFTEGRLEHVREKDQKDSC